MNKTELINEVAKKAGLTQVQAGAAMNAFIDIVGDKLQEGEKVSITGFGNFEPRQAAERQGKNPRNPEEAIIIPAHVKVAFKASKKLKEKVNE